MEQHVAGSLNESYIAEHGIQMLPEYADPYHNRPITAGEIGCFMSHYNIWKDMVENQHRTAIVFEDDIRFEPYFRSKLSALLTEVRHLDWDLISRPVLSDVAIPEVGTRRPGKKYEKTLVSLSSRSSNSCLLKLPWTVKLESYLQEHRRLPHPTPLLCNAASAAAGDDVVLLRRHQAGMEGPHFGTQWETGSRHNTITY
ncbi:procollagen galactosyltransferase 1-A [Ixodes scapularis]